MSIDSIGIDVSKERLDVARPQTGQVAVFANTTVGFRSLAAWLGRAQPDLVVFEPTGPYHGAFERYFAQRLPLVKVNPLQARRFAQACGTRAKTDAVDAAMLAAMGAALRLEPDQAADENQHYLKELQVARQALVNDRTRLLNRVKTQTLAVTRRQTRARLAQIERHLTALQKEIWARLRQSPRHARALDILCSIPGIGEITAMAIIIHCPELGSLGRKQVASLAGVAPITRQSGNWRGKSFIQGGRSSLRKALYMPALVAARKNPDLTAKYQSMIAAGKPPKLALTALMRKLIELANALIRDNRKWVQKNT